MPHYILRKASKATHVIADEIILAKDKTTGEITKFLSTARPSEIEADLLGDARKIARRMGYKVVETSPAEEEKGPNQPVGDDVVGMSPVNVPGADVQSAGAGQQVQPGAQDSAQAPAAPPATPVQTNVSGAITPAGLSGAITTP
jgi:hypothetical protein